MNFGLSIYDYDRGGKNPQTFFGFYEKSVKMRRTGVFWRFEILEQDVTPPVFDDSPC
jgi:hypothetical protein